MKKISFDFDDTLTEDRAQSLAIALSKTNEVWITTCRVDDFPEWNKDVYEMADKLNIPHERVQITNGDDKWRYLKDFDIHFDDDPRELSMIEKYVPSCKTVLI